MKAYLTLFLSFAFTCGLAPKIKAQTQSQLLKDIEILSSDQYEGRKTGTKGAEMARSYISGRFKSIGLHAFSKTYEHPFSFKSNQNPPVKGINLLGYLPGKTDNVIVISAHYDHLGIKNNEIYNGADDNASGVAGLLHIAAYFAKHQPNHTLIFAAFDAEEMGLQGAKAFVRKPPLILDKIKLNINMDMISHNDKNELYVCGTFKYPELKKFLFISSQSPNVIAGHDDPRSGVDNWTDQSDQGAFNEKNIPFLYFGVEDHKDYHKATDEYANINQAFFTDAANAILTITENIDKSRDIQKIFKSKLRMKNQ
jgi:Zn-dependent M28 family amino/carboxypeptidase